MLIRPRTGASLNRAHPLARGLVYARHFSEVATTANGIAADLIVDGLDTGITNSFTLGNWRGGIGITSGYAEALNTMQLPKQAGTAMIFVSASFSPTDSLQHYLADWGSDTADIVKYSDNNWYMGWTAAGRLVIAATNTFTAGTDFVCGYTYTAQGTIGYVNGKTIGSIATAPGTGTTTNQVVFGASNSGAQPWCKATGDAVYWALVWNRALSPREIRLLNDDPWQMWRPSFNKKFLFSLNVTSTTLTVDANTPTEFIGTLAADASTPDEFLAALATDGFLLIEAGKGFSSDAKTPTEELATAQISSNIQNEFIGSLQSDGIAPDEFLESRKTDADVLSENLATSRADTNVPTEILATARADMIVLDEWQGAVVVKADAIVPVEIIALARFDGYSPNELTASFASDMMIADESLMGFAWSGSATAEWLALRVVDAKGPTEFLGIVLTPLTADAKVPIELLATSGARISVEAFTPFEWLGAPVPPVIVSTGAIGPQSIVGPNPAGEVYIVPKGRGKGVKLRKPRSDYPGWSGWGKW